MPSGSAATILRIAIGRFLTMSCITTSAQRFTDSNENGKLIEEELRQREEINELIMTEDCIEMTCHLRYCPQCQGDPVSLFSVLGCNLYDGHETEHHHEPANESSDEDETQALSM